MASCSNCGQENPEIARFCLACGTPLAASTAPEEERRVVTVLFVDLVGFTARAERLDPEDVRAILTPYHDCVRREIQSFGGVVEKFIGDAVMAVFGAPTAFGDDAERAVRAALAVRDSVREMNERDDELDLQIRIAVNTGEAIVSLDAHPERGEAMIAGDVINTASRLQCAAPVNGILLGEETYTATRDAIVCEPATAGDREGQGGAVRRMARDSALQRRSASDAFRSPARRARRASSSRCAASGSGRSTSAGPISSRFSEAPGLARRALRSSSRAWRDALDGRTVRGRALPYRDSSAYGAFATQLKQFCRIFESDPL